MLPASLALLLVQSFSGAVRRGHLYVSRCVPCSNSANCCSAWTVVWKLGCAHQSPEMTWTKTKASCWIILQIAKSYLHCSLLNYCWMLFLELFKLFKECTNIFFVDYVKNFIKWSFFLPYLHLFWCFLLCLLCILCLNRFQWVMSSHTTTNCGGG